MSTFLFSHRSFSHICLLPLTPDLKQQNASLRRDSPKIMERSYILVSMVSVKGSDGRCNQGGAHHSGQDKDWFLVDPAIVLNSQVPKATAVRLICPKFYTWDLKAVCEGTTSTPWEKCHDVFILLWIKIVINSGIQRRIVTRKWCSGILVCSLCIKKKAKNRECLSAKGEQRDGQILLTQ